MAFDRGLIDRVAEALEPIGAVTHRPMMGGATPYRDGVVFAIADDDALWFKPVLSACLRRQSKGRTRCRTRNGTRSAPSAGRRG